MTRYYTIRPIVSDDYYMTDTILHVGNMVGLSYEDMLDELDLIPGERTAEFFNYCDVKGYNPFQIITNKLNAICIAADLNTRIIVRTRREENGISA